MNLKYLEERLIIGVSIMTTNENGQSGTDIPYLWNRFITDNLSSEIPNKISQALYCIYTDYESDFTKPYTTILGCEVSSLADIPDGFTGKIIESGSYLPFLVKGKMSDNIVFKEWENIWNSDIPRGYKTDFEVYGEKAQNPENVEIEIFLSIS